MTIQQFLSPTVRDWVNEMNEKNPNLSHDEFCKLFEEWFEKNEESIVLNESVDMSKYCRPLNEGDDFDFDDFDFSEDDDEEEEKTEIPKRKPSEPDPEPADEPEEEPTRKTEVVDDDDDDFSFEEGDDDEEETGTFKDVEGGDKEIKEKPVVIKPMSTEESEKVTSKIKGKYLVNNGEDYEHNIFNVVNAWYDDCIRSGNGENLKENCRITLLDTGVVEDMRALFAFANVPNLDLSGWDTSAVKNMEGMFYKSTFDSKSIEDWDVSMCINFKNMFDGCRFSGDISRWTPGKVLKTVFDDFGKPKMIHKKDSSGEDIKDPKTGEYIWTPEKVRVDADLPEVGTRKHGVNDAKNRRLLKALKSLDDAEKEKEAEAKEKRIFGREDESYDMQNIMDFDTFLNEGFVDTIKSGFNKVKKAIKAIAAKVNDFYIALFNEDGTLFNATNKFTTLNYVASGKVQGAKAYSGTDSSLLNANVKSKATIEDNGEYYGYIKKDSNEYKNFLTLLDALNKNPETGNDEVSESLINEEQMPLSSEGTGIDGVVDIGSDMLKDLMREMLDEAPAYKRNGEESKTIMIFGAPGIGKSSIPKSIIEEYNAGKDSKKKALVVIECGDLTMDGLYLPTPEFTTLADKLQKNPEVLKNLNLTDDELESFKKERVGQTSESPKTWLPVYMPTTDRKKNIALNASANGRTIDKYIYDEELGESVPVEETTTEGGIIMFDEFLRADPEMFKVLMQIVLNRRLASGHKFGSKWAFVCCSNRPCDDEEVLKRYESLSAAASTRFLKGVYNFIPDFYEWKEWAETKGGFDEYTLEFISRTDGSNKQDYKVQSYKGEKTATSFKNWHNVDMDDRRNFVSPMPRTWAALMDDINTEIRRRGVDNILDLPNEWIKTKAMSVIGKDTGERYANFLSTMARKGGPKMRELFNTDGYEIDTEEFACPEVSKRVLDYLKTNYFRRDGDVKLPKDKELFLMAKNMDRNYGKNGGSYLVGMHSTIVNDIFKIRSTDAAIIKRIRNYLKVVSKKYGVEFADGKPIEL